MTEGMLRVFGALRDADEHEVECALLAADTRLTKGQMAAAVRDLRRAGLIRTRREGHRRFATLNQRAVST